MRIFLTLLYIPTLVINLVLVIEKPSRWLNWIAMVMVVCIIFLIWMT